jgi:hypothetical protein
MAPAAAAAERVPAAFRLFAPRPILIAVFSFSLGVWSLSFATPGPAASFPEPVQTQVRFDRQVRALLQ